MNLIKEKERMIRRDVSSGGGWVTASYVQVEFNELNLEYHISSHKSSVKAYI
jgi:hypothetical protein